MSGSPWGSGGNDRPSGNGGGGGNRPPNIDDLANQFQDSLKKMFPGKKFQVVINQSSFLELLY